MNKYKNTDMKKILIISATSKSNYELSKKIYNILKSFNVKLNLICLEDYMYLFILMKYIILQKMNILV